MFGVVPKTIWQKKIPADSLNLCSWAMRCLLIEDGNRLILVDTGMGNKQPQKWQNYYFRHGDNNLESSIHAKGFSLNDVTDVLLSHLHFDHAGGAVRWDATRTKFELTFPKANYWTHSEQWSSAMNPNPRESATFLNENLAPIATAGQLNFVDKIPNPLGSHIELLYADGHTEKMIMPLIDYRGKKLIFVADTIPSHAHLHVPYVMGYDIRPLQTMQEKTNILEKAVSEDLILYFDHDPFFSCARVEKKDGKFTPKQLGELSDFF